MRRTRECREYRNFLGRRLRGLNAMFFPLPVTYFLVTYVLLLATQGTIGGVMQGSERSGPAFRGRFFAI